MNHAFKVKITGTELVENLKDGTKVTVLKVTCKGAGDGDRTKLSFYRIPTDIKHYPMGGVIELSGEIRQGSLDLSDSDGDESDAGATTEEKASGRRRAAASTH